MNVIATELPGVVIIEPTVYEDHRGSLHECYRADILEDHGINSRFVQDNQCESRRGVLRGLHYQLHNPQAKLCRAVTGAVLDVAVDVRVGSPTFGQHVAVELSRANRLMLYVPRGFAHGVLALEEDTIFHYRCDTRYEHESARGIIWNDPTLNISWGITDPILSDVDARLRPIEQVDREDLPHYEP